MIVLSGVPVEVGIIVVTMFRRRLGRRRGPMRGLMDDDRRLRGDDRDRNDQRSGYRSPRTTHCPEHRISYNRCAQACQVLAPGSRAVRRYRPGPEKIDFSIP